MEKPGWSACFDAKMSRRRRCQSVCVIIPKLRPFLKKPKSVAGRSIVEFLERKDKCLDCDGMMAAGLAFH